jgi:hypothetical protein
MCINPLLKEESRIVVKGESEEADVRRSWGKGGEGLGGVQSGTKEPG